MTSLKGTPQTRSRRWAVGAQEIPYLPAHRTPNFNTGIKKPTVAPHAGYYHKIKQRFNLNYAMEWIRAKAMYGSLDPTVGLKFTKTEDEQSQSFLELHLVPSKKSSD
jgi:hypothetical protein